MAYSEKLKDRALEKVKENYANKGKILAEKVAKDLQKEFDKVPTSATIRNWAKDITSKEKEQVEVKTKQNSKEATIQSERVLTPDELIDKMGVDETVWTIDKMRIGKHEVVIKDDDGEGQVHELFNMKVKLKRSEVELDKQAAKKAIEKYAERNMPKIDQKEYKERNQNNTAVILPADLHMWKLAYESYVGEEYNMDIAEDRLKHVLSNTIARLKQNGNPAKYIINIGNDGLHIDTPKNTTTSGTPQDVDGLYSVAKERLTSLRMWAINILQQEAEVEIVNTRGNHDKHSSLDIASTLEAVYMNNENVSIKRSENTWQAIKEGNNLFVFNHWDNYTSNAKRKTIPGEVRKRYADKIDENTNIHVFMGHLHSKKKFIEQSADSIHWVEIHYAMSVSGTDQWHNENGYIGNQKGMETMIYNKDKGQIAKLQSNINNNE